MSCCMCGAFMPPYSSGHAIAIHLRSASFFVILRPSSYGDEPSASAPYGSAPSQVGGSSARMKPRTSSRNDSSSGEKRKSMWRSLQSQNQEPRTENQLSVGARTMVAGRRAASPQPEYNLVLIETFGSKGHTLHGPV